MKKYHYISYAGWEDRFLSGASTICNDKLISGSTILYSQGYASETQKNRTALADILDAKKISSKFIEIDFSGQGACWRGVKDYFDHENMPRNVLVDITTMPREIIWYVFLLLKQKKCNVEYAYHKPVSYGDWLTEDTDIPRFPLKLSGISDISKKTFLIVVTGYDPARTEQICNYFEPDKVCFAVQIGKQFNNMQLNSQAHKELSEEFNALTIDIDCYGKDCGEETISNLVSEYRSSHNVVLASLGPKQSAVALFRVAAKYPEVALCYAPSKNININYSAGCGESFFGNVWP